MSRTGGVSRPLNPPHVDRLETMQDDCGIPDFESRSRDAACEILVVTDRRFWNRSIGSETRIANLLAHLVHRRERILVAYVGRLRRHERPALDAFRTGAARGLTVVTRQTDWRIAGIEFLRSLHERIPRCAAPRTPSGTNFPSPGFRMNSARRRFVDATIRRARPCIVLVELTRLSTLVHPRPTRPGPPARYLLDTLDVLARRAGQRPDSNREVAHDPFTTPSAIEEFRAFESFDGLIAIQRVEGALLRRHFPGKPVLIVPHGLASPAPPPPPCSTDGPVRLGFLGGRDPANVDALDWFVEAVWPTLRSRFGAGIAFHVAGQVCRRWPDCPADVGVLGPVDSIGDFWPEIDIAINPVRSGSGLKIKNVEALAHGRALVTTPIGAEGLESASPAGLRIATSPNEWISTLADWIEHPASARATACRGRAFFEDHFSMDRAFAELDTYLDHALREMNGGTNR